MVDTLRTTIEHMAFGPHWSADLTIARNASVGVTYMCVYAYKGIQCFGPRTNADRLAGVQAAP